MKRSLIFILLGAFLAGPAPAQVYDKVVSFTDVLADTDSIRDNRGYSPQDFIEGPDGNFYGTTRGESGGQEKHLPTVFKMTPDGILTTLLAYNGTSQPTAGTSPRLHVIGLDGFLYGAIPDGGSGGHGVLFKMPRDGVATSLVALGEFTNLTGSRPGKEPNFLMQGRDGWFYGLTRSGGAADRGTIFKVSSSGNFEWLKEFTGTGGATPGGSPVEMFQGRDGSFYGIAATGGAGDHGVVFRISSTGTYSPLAELTGLTGPRAGNAPSELFQARNGDLFGIATSGGIDDHGTVFRIATSGGWNHVADFSSVGGNAANTDLLQDSAGRLFGGGVIEETRTPFVFEIQPAGGITTVQEIHADWQENFECLILGGDGNLYGSTTGDPDSANGLFGLVFKLDVNGGYQELCHFHGDVVDNNGLGARKLIHARDGRIYGINLSGGKGEAFDGLGSGTIFRVSTDGEGFASIVDFGHPVYPLVPVAPHAAAILGGDDGFYGTSRNGGTDNLGTAYRLTPAGVLTMVKGFTGNDLEYRDPGTFAGAYPMGELIEGPSGVFYGITSSAEALVDSIHQANVFKISAAAVSATVVTSLVDGDYEYVSPYQVNSGLTSDGSGTFFGNAPFQAFRVNQDGTGFQKFDEGGGESSLLKSTDASGALFFGARDNRIYKLRPDGSSTPFATVFDPGPTYLSTASFQNVAIYDYGGDFTISFDLTPHQDAMNGVVALSEEVADSFSDLACGVRVFTNGFIEAYNGDIDNYEADTSIPYVANQTYRVSMTVDVWDHRYSVSVNGVPLATDYAFRDSQMEADTLTQLALIKVTGSHSVSNIDNGQHATIVGSLLEDTDGTLYGTTAEGGTAGHGKVFKVSPAGVVSILASFSGNGASNKGSRPVAALMKHADGYFYGTTSRGGANDLGTVFRMSSGGAIETLFEFDADSRDSIPMSRLVMGPDGNLYGTTAGSGGGAGGVYRLIFDGPPSIYPMDGAPLGFDRYGVSTKLNACGSGANAWIEYWIENPADPDAEPADPLEIPLSASFSGYRTVDAAATLPNLQQGVTYRYRIAAANSDPLVSRSDSFSFQTSAAPTVDLIRVLNINNTTTRFYAEVNAHNSETTVTFEYGTDGITFGGSVNGTPATVTGNGVVEVTVAPDNLLSGQTYFVRVKAKNAVGSAEDGDIEFTTLTPPEARVTGATALSSTRVRLAGMANAKGSEVDVHFEYRLKPEVENTPWGDDNDPYRATPGTLSSSQEVEVTRELSGLIQGATYEYRVVATGDGGEDFSDPGTFTLSLLSGLLTRYPDEPGGTNGAITINFTPPAVGAWRFRGETEWRVSGEAAGHLAGGSRVIEFLTIPGFAPLPAETVEVSGGESQVLERSYTANGGGGTGNLTVTLLPDSLAGAQWCFEDETVWRNSTSVPLPLASGSYRIVFKEVTGRVTPPLATVVVGAGQLVPVVRTYEEPFTALTPVAFDDVIADEELPYAYLGQIRSRAGTSTGFAVKRRVVATAAHVVFDDSSLSYIPELQWLHQRHAGEHEPLPQIPRGYYLLAGYADQRRAEATPGESSPLSQHLDGAALFFTQDAARGGYGGYLASEKGDSNEFLGDDSAGAAKFLAGYADEGVAIADRGKLHVSPPFTGALDPAFGETWVTAAVLGTGGCSGGPLFVRHGTQGFFPAAIYLGGSGQAVVRAIDREMVNLFLRAETSGNGGGNNTSGGITLTTVTTIGSSTVPALVSVRIEPEAARANARWKLHYPNELVSSNYRNNDSLSVESTGAHILELTPVSGFEAPQPIKIEISGGTSRTYTYTYGSTTALEAWRLTHFGTKDNLGIAADTADPDGDGWDNLSEYSANTNPKNAGDRLKVNSATHVGSTFTITAAAKTGRRYALERSTDLAGDDWTTVDTEGPLTTDGTIMLSDPAAPASRGFYRIRVSLP